MAPNKRHAPPDNDDAESVSSKHMRIDSDGHSETESEAETDAHEQVADVYLDTVDRSSLDFDFEQLCSVSLATTNVYACLVCGKYFQGRGKQTHAYFHSINDDHHVFINLDSLKIFVLPDNYEVTDKSLNDIKDVVRPVYSAQSVLQLDRVDTLSHDLGGKPYVPGFVGLNRIKSNSYMNVVIQMLAHVAPIRDALLLLPPQASNQQSALLCKLAMLVRRMWHSRRFKAHVSPHEFVQEVVLQSKRRFRLDVEGDPYELLVWLLNTLHICLGGSRKRNSSVVYGSFQGEMRVTTQGLGDTQARAQDSDPLHLDRAKALKTTKTPFLALSLELPPKPLFTSTTGGDTADDDDNDERADIPQVALSTLLQRYNGSTVVELNGQARQFQLTKLPRYIICHIKRFSKNDFTAEKNPTVVNFPVRNMPFGELLPKDTKEKYGRGTTYDLVANICHVGDQLPAIGADSSAAPDVPTESAATAESPFVVYVRHAASHKWFALHDLRVEPIMPQMLFLSDSYIQVWQRND
ncbi:Ubiquitin carboxyl-terminal hydrolase 10 [Coemansia sp. RSA 2702]|nr:U4 U6.U5 tri-snRNP-associated protein [Coemansia sp. RSA 2705]KAJ2327877.1 Ubiquitin carboxyl-terminal hydrolase 10 [Coemansia sp. RSA 2702]